MIPVSDVMVVSFNKGVGDGHELLLVGKQTQRNKPIQIMNAFSGQDAIDIYKKLTTPSGLLDK